MKACTKCGEAKPLEAFSPNRHVKSGRQSQCKVCCSVATSLRHPRTTPLLTQEERHRNRAASDSAYYQANREKRLAEMRERYAKVALEDSARRRADYAANRAHELEAKKAYSQKHKERIAARQREAHKANPWKKTAANKARKTRKFRATPAWADNRKILAVYEFVAFLRSIGVDCHVDHIVPLHGRMASGLHTHDNLQVLIATDNLRKGNKMPEDPNAVEPAWKALVSVSD